MYATCSMYVKVKHAYHALRLPPKYVPVTNSHILNLKIGRGSQCQKTANENIRRNESSSYRVTFFVTVVVPRLQNGAAQNFKSPFLFLSWNFGASTLQHFRNHPCAHSHTTSATYTITARSSTSATFKGLGSTDLLHNT